MRGRSLRIVGIALVGFLPYACGGSGGGVSTPNSPGAPVVVDPAPVVTPSPTATPAPTPSPSAAPEPVLNMRPVAKVTIKIEFIDCPATGELNQHGPFNWTSVGCRIHFDLTPRDRYNKPTEGAKGHPDWHVNDPSLVYMSETGYTPVFKAEKTGKLKVQGELDGVRSNTVEISLY